MARKRRKKSLLARGKAALKLLGIFLLFVILGMIGSVYVKENPENFPWTQLSLNQPIGLFTGRKLAALNGEFPQCQLLLNEAGVMFEPFPASGADQCRRDQNVSLLAPPADRIAYRPQRLSPTCPVVAALKVWEDRVVQAAAIKIFGQNVKSIRHFGSYNCRKISGRDAWSEHATGNAIDVAAFELADGKIISLSGSWTGAALEAQFLREVRDGSCDLFATVLSPDYNAAHADHFHFDQAPRGAAGNRICR